MRQTMIYLWILVMEILGFIKFWQLDTIADGESYWHNHDYEFPMIIMGFVVVITVLILIFGHFVPLLQKGYDYNCFVARRDAYAATLKNARDNERELEAVKILKDTMDWNDTLACKKMEHTHWLYSPYIDDRYLTLEPIY
jgi:hypothetical protein